MQIRYLIFLIFHHEGDRNHSSASFICPFKGEKISCPLLTSCQEKTVQVVSLLRQIYVVGWPCFLLSKLSGQRTKFDRTLKLFQQKVQFYTVLQKFLADLSEFAILREVSKNGEVGRLANLVTVLPLRRIDNWIFSGGRAYLWEQL